MIWFGWLVIYPFSLFLLYLSCPPLFPSKGKSHLLVCGLLEIFIFLLQGFFWLCLMMEGGGTAREM